MSDYEDYSDDDDYEDYIEYEGMDNERKDEYYTYGVYKPTIRQRILTLYNRFKYWLKYRNDNIPF